MNLDVINMQGKKVGEAELPAQIFETEINVSLMHQAFVRQMANARLGTHKTKNRSEVRGGGRKPWRQKGTGRARHGSIRSPIWPGGGKIHTPRPRDYTKQMPRQMRRGALRSALSAKAAENQIILVDKLEMEAPSTRSMLEALNAMAGDQKALVLLASRNETVEKSLNNLPDAKGLRASYLNIRDLFNYDALIMPLDALEQIKDWLGTYEAVEVQHG